MSLNQRLVTDLLFKAGNPAPLLSPLVNDIDDVTDIPLIALGPIPPGATVIVEHGIHESVLGPASPTIVFPDRATPLIVVSANEFTVTIFNPDLVNAQEVLFRAERKHTIEETPTLLLEDLWKGIAPGGGGPTGPTGPAGPAAESCCCAGPCEFKQDQQIATLGAALSSDLVVDIDVPNPEGVPAAQLNAAAAGTFTRTFQAHLETAGGLLHSWANLTALLVPGENAVDPDVLPPTLPNPPDFVAGVITVLVVFDTDAGATKTYAPGDSVTVDISVSVLGFAVPVATKTYNVV